MKKYVYLFLAILGLILYTNHGFYFALYAFLITVFFVALVIDRINIFFTNRNYSKEYENIYVIHTDPIDSEEPEIPAHLKDFIVITSYKKVCEEIENQEFLLRRSGNVFFCDETLTDDQKLQVKGIIMQDGEFINEDFSQYNVRLIEEIQADRKSRHSMLKKTDAIWYNQFANFQKGVDWGK